MSVSLTKTEIIAGSVDGTVRTFDIRMGRYVNLVMLVSFCYTIILKARIAEIFLVINIMMNFQRNV